LLLRLGPATLRAMSALVATLSLLLLCATPGRADDNEAEQPVDEAGQRVDDAPTAAPSIPADSAPQQHAPPPPPVQLTPPDRLAAAVRSYHLGQHDLALSRLTALTRELPDDSTISRDARLYIGEIFFVQGNESGAREAFEAVVRSWPDHVLDPFRHPPDVCAFFELVKEDELRRIAVEAVLPDPAAERPPPSPFLPLGVAQFRQRRVLPGILFSIGQTASCGLSIGLGTWLLLDRHYDPTPSDEATAQSDGSTVWDRETLVARRSAQWAATGVCYGSYALGVTDAWLAGRRQARRSEQAALPRQAPMVVFTRRF